MTAARGRSRNWDRTFWPDSTRKAWVAAGAWQSARSLGAWTLMGCTVAPGFDFAGFELAPQGWEP